MPRSIKSAFRPKCVSIEVKQLSPTRKFDPRERSHQKYKQIAASIAAVGVIEPLVVFPLPGGSYRILDGHKRYDVLLNTGVERVDCILSLDDECYTFNRRVNYLSSVGENQMILRALEHNSEERIAAALNVNISTIRRKRDLLDGVCKEAVTILRDRRVSPQAFNVLKKLKPVRQIESAQLMIASNMYSGRFAEALLAGTKDEMLVEPTNDRSRKSISPEQRMRLERETETLIRDLKTVEESYGTDVLSLSVACKYVARILANVPLRRRLTDSHPELLHELEGLLAAVDTEFDRSTASS